MPDAYDPISARIIEYAGFHAVQCSGYSMAIASCYRSETELSLQENVEMTRKIAQAVNVPVMADGEDGYGDPETVQQTIHAFVDAGAAGINLEDLIPCHTDERRVIDATLMVEKLIAAREAAIGAGIPDFIINARTDALCACTTRRDGLNEAIRRANHYLAAGADLVFVCYVATLEEAKALVHEIPGSISIAAGQPYNIHAFTVDDLRQLGVTRVSLPTLAIMSAIHGLATSLSLISEPQGFERIAEEGLYCPPNLLTALLRVPEGPKPVSRI